MADDLGARLVQAGLVTRGQLARVLGSAPAHEGALVTGLIDGGLDEDALAGFFVAAGFGPLMLHRDLAAAEPHALARVPASMAHGLLVLPIKESVAGLVIAMAAPSDPHAVRELSRIARAPVLPTVARVGELRVAIAAAYPSTPTRERPPPRVSEPPVLELVQRKKKKKDAPPPGSDPTPPMGSAGYGDSTRGAARVEARALVGPRLVADDEEGFVPLVRHKAVAPAGDRPRKITRDFERTGEAGTGTGAGTGAGSGAGSGSGAGAGTGTGTGTGAGTGTGSGAAGTGAGAGIGTGTRAGLVRCGAAEAIVVDGVAAFDAVAFGGATLIAWTDDADAGAVRVTRIEGETVATSIPSPCWTDPQDGLCGAPRLATDGARVMLVVRQESDLRALVSEDGARWSALEGLEQF